MDTTLDKLMEDVTFVLMKKLVNHMQMKKNTLPEKFVCAVPNQQLLVRYMLTDLKNKYIKVIIMNTVVQLVVML